MKQETENREHKVWCVASNGLTTGNDYLVNLEYGCWMPYLWEEYAATPLKEFFEYYGEYLQFFGERPSKEEVHEILIGAWLFVATLPEFNNVKYWDRVDEAASERARNGAERPSIDDDFDDLDDFPSLPSDEGPPNVASIVGVPS